MGMVVMMLSKVVYTHVMTWHCPHSAPGSLAGLVGGVFVGCGMCPLISGEGRGRLTSPVAVRSHR
jgi:hypothetical protein